ncbi:hypothetical protein ACRRTK_008716 [Alexandromys fortis]
MTDPGEGKAQLTRTATCSLPPEYHLLPSCWAPWRPCAPGHSGTLERAPPPPALPNPSTHSGQHGFLLPSSFSSSYG